VFENLLFQDRVKEQLSSMLAGGKVPPSLLFTGPEGSGKQTAALECARVLSCEREGLWNCECAQCRRHRSLTHPDLLLFGPRSFPQEASVTAEYFLRSPNLTSYYAFVRSIRKLLKRFDPALWAGEEARLSKAAPSIESLEEQLQEIQALVSGPKAKAGARPLDTTVNRVVETAFGLEALVPDGVPIFMVRNMAAWAVLAPVGKSKTVILQNADTANESTRNAMLKILEEPPETVRFILTSSRRAAVIATILSRSRLISFEPRTAAQAQHIVSRLFRSEAKVENIGEFFHGKSPFPPDKAEGEAALFVGALLGRAMEKDAAMSGDRASNLVRQARNERVSALGVMRDVAEQTGNFGAKNAQFSNSFFVFLRAAARQLASVVADPTSSAALIVHVDRLSSKLRDAGVQYRSFNRSPELLLEAFADMFGEIP
jgi:DNA polymerase III delta prime subunit